MPTSQQFIFLTIWCQSRFSPLHHALLNLNVNCLNLTNLQSSSLKHFYSLVRKEEKKFMPCLMFKDLNFLTLFAASAWKALFFTLSTLLWCKCEDGSKRPSCSLHSSTGQENRSYTFPESPPCLFSAQFVASF